MSVAVSSFYSRPGEKTNKTELGRLDPSNLYYKEWFKGIIFNCETKQKTYFS